MLRRIIGLLGSGRIVRLVVAFLMSRAVPILN